MLATLLFLQVAGAAPEPLGHLHQFSLSVDFGSGARFIAPYNDGEFCGQAGKRVCVNHVPVFMELELGYGVASALDLIADLRFGVEGDFNTSHDFHFAPGIKYFIDPDKAFKLYATFQLVFDSEDQPDTSLSSFDFGLRNANGLQYELLRNLGLFAQFGETLGFVRWLRIELDFAGGVQGRFP